MKYIDADRLKAEINKHIGRYDSILHEYSLSGVKARREEAFSILTIIESLQQEQPDLPGIEESGIPGKDYIPVDWVDACEMYGKWKIVKQEQPEVDLEKELKNERTKLLDAFGPMNGEQCLAIRNFARHFYELGLNARKK